MIQCPHAQHGICQVATRLANQIVAIDAKACSACQKQMFPMELNRVTAAIAVNAQRKSGTPIDSRLHQIASGVYHLAGYRVRRGIEKWLKRLRITPAPNCGCDGWVSKMNDWGVAQSLDRIDEITDAIYANLKTTYLSSIAVPWVSKLAIKRAVKKWLLNERL